MLNAGNGPGVSGPDLAGSVGRTAEIHPILLCGGSGSRLWPISRQCLPKQFGKLMGGGSLFQACAQRFSGPGFAAPVVVTSHDCRFIVAEQLAGVNMAAAATLLEPEPRNTAPAVLAAALWLYRQSPDSVMLISPSDHMIPDAAAFRKAIDVALPAALAGMIVTFGIAPTCAETGYGYLKLAPSAAARIEGPHPLTGFVEKPARQQAEAMLMAGNCLWNAGLFLLTTRTMLNAFEEHAPDMMRAATDAVDGVVDELGFSQLAAQPWAQLPSISIDRAIMERAKNLSVMPYHGRWSDLGSWDAVWREMTPDPDGNVVSHHALAIDCHNSMLRSDAGHIELVGIGLQDIIAVAMRDAVLVARKSATQQVGEAVNLLKTRTAHQAIDFSQTHRPWGWYETLDEGARFKVKRIVVKPGGMLSLQSHQHRAEHWVVVQGMARITIGEEIHSLSESEAVHISLGAVHRLENAGPMELILIEVQTGSYLGEDDIIRYEDAYARR